jgi:hypothetical protein
VPIISIGITIVDAARAVADLGAIGLRGGEEDLGGGLADRSDVHEEHRFGLVEFSRAFLFNRPIRVEHSDRQIRGRSQTEE